MSNSLRPYGPQPASLLCPWDSLGKDTWVRCHALLQGIFPTQESNRVLLCLLLWQLCSLPLVLPGKPEKYSLRYKYNTRSFCSKFVAACCIVVASFMESTDSSDWCQMHKFSNFIRSWEMGGKETMNNGTGSDRESTAKEPKWQLGRELQTLCYCFPVRAWGPQRDKFFSRN